MQFNVADKFGLLIVSLIAIIVVSTNAFSETTNQSADSRALREYSILIGSCSDFVRSVKPVVDKRQGDIALSSDVKAGMYDLLAVQGFLHGRLYRNGSIDKYETVILDYIAYESCKINPDNRVFLVMEGVLNGSIPTAEEVKAAFPDTSRIYETMFYYQKGHDVKSPLDAKCREFNVQSFRRMHKTAAKLAGDEYSPASTLDDDLDFYMSYIVGFLAGAHSTTGKDNRLVLGTNSVDGRPAINQGDYDQLFHNMILGCNENRDRKILDIVLWVSKNKLSDSLKAGND